jgi:urease subunit gamma/beta
VRFEPGEECEVSLVAFGGSGELRGLNGLTNGGDIDDALARARDQGYEGA